MKSFIRFKNSDGIGLIESVIALTLLTILTTYSLYFIARRQKIILNSNITNAINDEIRRDIEKLKSELWSDNYQPAIGGEPAYYNIDSSSCRDIKSRIENLPSWNPTSWIPGSNISSVQGQIRSKILTGGGVKITRNLVSSAPIITEFNTNLDNSIVKVIYEVQTKNFDKTWTIINLNTESYSWCPPNE